MDLSKISLHEEQINLTNMSGNLLVSCPAGWGKTFSLLYEAYKNPNINFLCLMFNRKVMEEVKSAAEAAGLKNLTVSTFHTFGNGLLKQIQSGYAPDFNKSYKSDKYYSLASWCEKQFKEQLAPYYERLKREGVRYSFPSKVVSIIEFAQRELIYPTSMSVSQFEAEIVSIINREYVSSEIYEPEHFYYAHYILSKQFIKEPDGTYRAKLVNFSGGKYLSNVSFADMLYFPNFMNIKNKQNYDVLFVDEFQDLTPSFRSLVLSNTNVSKFIAFGDVRQDINRWNGARVMETVNILSEVFNAKLVEFNSTFRYGTNIANGINQYFGYNIKTLKNSDGVFNIEDLTILDDFMKSYPKNSAIITYKNSTCAYTFLDLTSKGYKVGIFNTELQTTFTEMVNDLQSVKISDMLEESAQETEQFRKNLLKKGVKFDDISSNETYKSLQIFSDFIKILNLDKPQLIQYIKDIFNVNPDKKDRGVIITTANKSKGLTFENVCLLNKEEFFKIPQDVNNKHLEEVQRRNLLYVALTRATNTVIAANIEIPPKYSEAKKSENSINLNNEVESED